MNFNAEIDWEEALAYRPGLTVELKAKPGTFDTIACYEPMMVPPIWLEQDPRPHYPHELRVMDSRLPTDIQAASLPQVKDKCSSGR